MSGARDAILNRIGSAMARNPEARIENYAAIPRHYLDAGQLDLPARLDLFIERLNDYQATVYRCGEPEIQETVAQAMHTREKKALSIPAGIPRNWLPDGFAFSCDEAATYVEMDRTEGVLTGCAVAVALTGTIVLEHSSVAGRRATTLIPDYHLCVVFASQLVETVPEGIRRIEHATAAPLTTISGPSATSDIEMTRVKGVHGPRVLDVIVVLDVNGNDQKSI